MAICVLVNAAIWLGVQLCHWVAVKALTWAVLNAAIWAVPKPAHCVGVSSLRVLLLQVATWLGLNALICEAERLCLCPVVRDCNWVLSMACN